MGQPLLTQILTHTGKLLDSTGEEAADGVGCPGLHCGGDVGIGVQSEACGVMAQHGGQGFDVHAVLEGQDGERMPLWHNKDKSENPCVATG